MSMHKIERNPTVPVHGTNASYHRNMEATAPTSTSVTKARRTTKPKPRTPLDDEIDALEARQQLIFAEHAAWTHHYHEHYNGYGTKCIMNMEAYYLNIERGFGHCNSESNYQMHRARDTEGKWLEEAMRGVEISMRSHRLHQEILKLKIERGDFAKRSRRVP